LEKVLPHHIVMLYVEECFVHDEESTVHRCVKHIPPCHEDQTQIVQDSRGSTVMSSLTRKACNTGSKILEHMSRYFQKRIQHRGTFFSTSGVHISQTHQDHFHYRRVIFYSHLKSKVDNILTNTVTVYKSEHRWSSYRRTTGQWCITPV
jgi:hypothetical protein